jgi:hypothetical protein
VLRRTFGPKKEEVARSLRRLHREKLHNLHPSPIINIVIKSRRIICAGHVARRGEMKNAYTILVGKPEDHSEDLGVDERIII